MKTHLPKVNLEQRKWHVIDANGAVLGRLAVQIADTLRGKNKPVYTPHLDAGDFVVVINAEKVDVDRQEGNREIFHDLFRLEGRGGLPVGGAGPGEASGEADHARGAGHGAQEPAGPEADDET